MKRREIFIDLTALLDIILILFFSVLILNTGQLSDFHSRLIEAEEYLSITEEFWVTAEQERIVAGEMLDELMLRLEALDDWDSERLEFIDRARAQYAWRVAVEQAIFFIYIHVEPDNGRRMAVISTHDTDESVEIIWALDDRNIIINTGFVTNEIHRILDDRIAHRTTPIIIMFNDAGIFLQEFNTIIQALHQFIGDRTEFIIRYSIYR